ncbi:Cupredoxin [Podospora appendiculata]|uniref:Cupredoxin n=1 Tax=Podospora appendiculata TaxID=314037 RepID=A0AAE1CC60_9PEZI|nr:Cupredoxin [Podospora appendiculata]
MRFYNSLVVLLAGVTSLATATPFVDWKKRASCANTATSRNCWGNYSISDDVTYTWPTTGVTRSYTFNIQYTTLAPDGVSKQMMTVNGQYPGPTIEANWGDDISVQVCNQLTLNGTGIHFHGIRHLNTNYADGATAQTECSIAPGDCHTYNWKATQHGTSWYHSHYSLQYADGVLGPIVIHGPHTANWDIDLGPLVITDYYHESAFALAGTATTQTLGIPPVAVSGLINGKNTNLTTGGSRYQMTFTKGKKHLIRLINTGSEVIFRFAIDKHTLTVVAVDLVPINPYVTDTILIAVGQRYDVIVEADQDIGNYWARGVPMMSCFAVNLMAFDIRAVVRYDASSTADPTVNQSIPYVMLDVCQDESLSNLVPYISHSVGPSAVSKDFNAVLLPSSNDNYYLRWQVGGSQPYRPLKSNPVIKQIFANSTANITTDLIPIDLTSLQGTNWVYIVVESLLPLPHPLHLHGHDNYVLARGAGPFLANVTTLQLANPPRRDTVNLPQTGFIVLGFKTDNPGSWLLHCHIQWHLHDGFAMSIVERPKSEIKAAYTKAGEDTEMQRVCKNWAASGLDSRG